MRCLYCGKHVWSLRRHDDDFCCAEHRKLYHARLRRAFDLLPKYSGPPPADLQQFCLDDLQGFQPEVKCRIADEPYWYPGRVHIPVPEAQSQTLGLQSYAASGAVTVTGPAAPNAARAYCGEREFGRPSLQARCVELQLAQTRGSEIAGRPFIPQIEAAMRQPGAGAFMASAPGPVLNGACSVIYPVIRRSAGVSVPHANAAGLNSVQPPVRTERREAAWTAALPFDASRLAGPQLTRIPAISPAPPAAAIAACQTFEISGGAYGAPMPGPVSFLQAIAAETSHVFSPQLSGVSVSSAMTAGSAASLRVAGAEPRAASTALRLESITAAGSVQLPKPTATLYLADRQQTTVSGLTEEWPRPAAGSTAQLAAQPGAPPRQSHASLNGNGHVRNWPMPASGLVNQVMGPVKELRPEALPIRHDASPIPASFSVTFGAGFESTCRGLPVHADPFECFPTPAPCNGISFDALPMDWAKRAVGTNLRESPESGTQIIPINRSAKIEGRSDAAQLQGKELEEQPQFNTRIVDARMPAPHSLFPMACEAKPGEAQTRTERLQTPVWMPPQAGLGLGPLSLSNAIAQTAASRVLAGGAIGLAPLEPVAPEASALRDRTLELMRISEPSMPALVEAQHASPLAAQSEFASEIMIASRELRAEALPIRHSASPVHFGFLFPGLSDSFEPKFEDLYDSLVAAESGVELPLAWKMTPAADLQAKIAAPGFARHSSPFALQFAAIRSLDSRPLSQTEPRFSPALSQIRPLECRAALRAATVPGGFETELPATAVEAKAGKRGIIGGAPDWTEPSSAANFDKLAVMFGISGLGWAERTPAGSMRPEVQAVTLPMCAAVAPAELVTRATPQQVDALQAALAFSLAMFPQPAQLLPIGAPQAGLPEDSRPEGWGEPIPSYLPAQEVNLAVGPDAPATPVLAGQPWVDTVRTAPENDRTGSAVPVFAGELESNLYTSGMPVHLPECITLANVLELDPAEALDSRAINQKKSALAFGFRPVETNPRLPGLEHEMGPLALKIFVPKSWPMAGITEPEQRPPAPSNLYSMEDPLRRKLPTRIGGNMQHYLRGVAAAFFVALLVWASSHSSGLHAKFQGSQNWVRRGLAQRAIIELADNFHSGLERWQGTADVAQSWSFDKNGYIHVGHLALYRPSIKLTDYKMEFLAQIEHKSMGWVVRATDSNNYYAVKLTITNPGPKPMVALVRYAVIDGKAGRRVQTPVQAVIHNDRPYRIQVEVKGNVIRASVEGQTIDTWTDDNLKSGGVGFFNEEGEKSRLYWVKVSNHDDALGRMCAMLAPRQT